MLSLSHQFLFIHIPKTGGNSIQHILRHYSEDAVYAYPHQDGVERFEVRGAYTKWKHDNLAQYKNVVPADIYDQLFKFSVIRDPWSRAISFYFSPHRWVKRQEAPYWSRELFLTTLEGLRSNFEYLTIGDGLGDLHEIVRYERLQEALPGVLRRAGIDPTKHRLPHVNRSRTVRHRDYYRNDPELIAIVRDRFRDDIDHFGFRFEA